ncbi:hypothetical protein F4803DRAFT_370210 [Xylaria telfairii]|nr:hypothetical protein F4803DRAFT_370210 [Xylaria telfairii]
MRDGERIAEFVTKHNVVLFRVPPPLSRPSFVNFVRGNDRDTAQEKLLQLRRSNGDKDPASGFRARIGLQTPAAIAKKNTTFTLNERRAVFEDALEAQEYVGVAQAVMEMHPDKPFDVNVGREVVKSALNISSLSIKRNHSTKNTVTPSRWLQIATERGQKDYVILLASRQRPAPPSQNSLNESLQIALKQRSRPVVKELLRYGADPNTCVAEFHIFVGHGDAGTEFTELLLNSSTHALDQCEKDTALLKAIELSSIKMISQLLAFGADANYLSGYFFKWAVKRQDFKLLTLLVSTSRNIRPESLQDAIDHVCKEDDLSPQDKVAFLDLLLSAGASTDPHLLANLLDSAIQHCDLNMMSLLVRHREISSNQATKAMGRLPSNLSEDQALDMCSYLFDARAQGAELGSVIWWAVQRDYRHMVVYLVNNQISLDYRDAAAVRYALERLDLPLLQLLFNGDGSEPRTSIHSKAILAKALPDALAIKDRKIRHRAIELLLNKGVSGEALDQALEDVITKPAICHILLVKALLSAGADVNFHGAQPIKAALKLTDVQILDHICEHSRITQESFDVVLPIAIDCSRDNQSKARLLLRDHHQYFQRAISKALVEEVKASGGQDEIVRLLLDHGANVNYERGKLFGEIVSNTPATRSMHLLRDALSRGPDQTALGTAFDSTRQLECPLEHRLALFSSILEAGYQGPSIHTALREVIASHPDNTSVPDLLLRYGASVDYDNGGTLVSALQSRNLQLLTTIMSYHPNASSINRAFEYVCQRRYDNSLRVQQLEYLIGSDKVSGASMTSGLTYEVIHGQGDLRILSLLGGHQGRLKYEALLHLVNNHDIAIIKFLFELQTPNKETRSRAFQSCFEFDKAMRFALAELLLPDGIDSGVWTGALRRSILDRDHDLLKLLLHHRGGQSFKAGESLIFAADQLDPASIEILLQSGPGFNSRDCAFERMLESGKMTSTKDSRRAAILLLAQGISQRMKDRALIQSLQSFSQNRFEFARTLVEHGANVNAEACICFSVTGQFAELDAFRYLLTCNPNFDLVVSSLVYSFAGRYDRLVEILRITLTSDFYHDGNPRVDVIVQAMHRYPYGTELIRLLLDHGYPAGQHVELPGDWDGATETGTPLIWALRQPRPWVKDAVILELLKEESRARPEFITGGTEVSAIILAAQNGRHEIMERLVELNVPVSGKDCHDKSPLFYASTNKDARSVSILLGADAQENDGSLHEAARLCQSGIVAMLLKNDHDPNYPSELHGGRTPLGEMCLRSPVDSRLLESQAYDTIQVLLGFKADLGMRMGKKTVLHLALENDRPVEMTKVLLRFPTIYKDIRTDSEAFLYEDSLQISMSPDNYVATYCQCSERLKEQLIALLREKHCKDKWYKRRGAQVASPRGLPPAMREEQERQDFADQSQLRAIERKKKDAAADIEIANMRHVANIKQGEEQNKADLANRTRLHDQQIDHENAMSSQRRGNAYLEHTDRKARAMEMATIEYQASEALVQLRSSAMEKEHQMERQMITAKVEAEKTVHDRAMMRIQRQEELNRSSPNTGQRPAIEAKKWDDPD